MEKQRTEKRIKISYLDSNGYKVIKKVTKEQFSLMIKWLDLTIL